MIKWFRGTKVSLPDGPAYMWHAFDTDKDAGLCHAKPNAQQGNGYNPDIRPFPPAHRRLCKNCLAALAKDYEILAIPAHILQEIQS